MIDSAAGSGRRRSRPGRAGDRHLARSGGDGAGPAAARPIDGRSVAPIGDAKPRIAGCFGGNVCRLVVHPLSGTPTFEVQLDDGTGRINALFLGRRGIAGMWCGRQLVIAGTPVAAPRGLPVYNPEYLVVAGRRDDDLGLAKPGTIEHADLAGIGDEPLRARQ